MKKVTIAYFSPSGTSKEVAKVFASTITEDVRYLDLLKNPVKEEENFDENDLFVAVMPVFAGRIPSICSDILHQFKGASTPAVIIAVYGNRDFDDALLEMNDILQENNFQVIGAAAFIARHSIFPEVAKNRPDENDKNQIKQFAQLCLKKSEEDFTKKEPLKIPGNHPYKKVSSMPMRPTGKKATCTKCNICVNMCPVHAINSDEPTKTDKSKCITCMACVYHCPTQSRGLHTPLYKVAKGSFEKKCATAKKPSIFI